MPRAWRQTFALIILLLTGADLLNPQCCADEIASLTARHAGLDAATTMPQPPSEFGNTDDCVCCARHLEITAKAAPAHLDALFAISEFVPQPLVLRSPHIDHPPQLA